jgi:hypothetical protein
VVRGVQISLNTRPKPTRASAYECGVTNQSTSQSTYAIAVDKKPSRIAPKNPQMTSFGFRERNKLADDQYLD